MSTSPPPTEAPKRRDDGPTLDTTHFHALLLGTGLTNTILASALSKSSHSVLHLDQATEYGAHLSTLNLTSLKQFIDANRGTSERSTNDAAVSSEVLSEWKTIAADADGKYQYEPLRTSSSFFNATFVDYTEVSTSIPAAVESTPSSSSSADDATEDATAPETAAPTVASPVTPSLMSEARRFSLDVTPHLVFSRSPIIDLLVAAGIHNYVEFKAVDHAYFAAATPATSASSSTSSSAPNLQPLPLSKSSIFQTSSLSMLDKRILMKFMHLIMGDDYHLQATEADRQKSILTDVTAGDAGQSFVDFLKAQKLTPNLMNMVLYAVAMLGTSLTASSSIPARVGVARLRTYLSSLGRYGAGAFLYPNYGVSELPQAFARLCAVNKGIFILRFKPEAIVYETPEENASAERRYKGVITTSGQFITSDVLVADVDYSSSISVAPSSSFSSSYVYLCRAILFLDSPLQCSTGTMSGSSSFSFSPSSPTDPPVYGLQLGWETSVAPKGRVVVYLWTTAETLDAAKETMARLEALAKQLTREITATEGEKPRLLGMATYQQKMQREDLNTVIPTIVASVAVESSKSVESTEEAAPKDVGAVASGSTTATDASASSTASSDDATSAAAAFPTAPSLSRATILTSAPSSSLAFGLDGCLTQAEAIFRRLCPTLNFHQVVLAEKQEEQYDADMSLLQQIVGDEERTKATEEDDDETDSKEEIFRSQNAGVEETKTEDGPSTATQAASETSSEPIATAANETPATQ